MRFFSAEEEAFRAEVVEFLQDWRDLDGFFLMGTHWARVSAFFRALGERGWLSLGWPQGAGGLGRSPAYEYILWDECAYVRAARPPLDAGIVAKTIIRYGTEAQKERWLPAIRRGESTFSLGYSEPEAGSDLAGLRTRAERDGGDYVVTGQKCWTSYAQDTDWLWTLARTGAPDSRGDGLSLLILDLHAPGVTVRPLPTLDDEALGEIHLDGVRVPADHRVGPENGAWKIMAEALADERHVQFPPKRLRRDLEELVAFARGHGLADDPVVRRSFADLAVRVAECEMHGLRVLDQVLKGRSGLVEAAANKVVQSVVCQELARAALDLGGPAALVRGEPVEFLWRQSTWETIGGGTSEVMRGVVARQGLGLGGRR
ncbi:MAG: acyl-CoA dehydrogenase family protein [Myxococcota bacterium]|nr:acyl-CoA dehydrogenase family protein [Myxococcota bacterium]